MSKEFNRDGKDIVLARLVTAETVIGLYDEKNKKITHACAVVIERAAAKVTVLMIPYFAKIGLPCDPAETEIYLDKVAVLNAKPDNKLAEQYLEAVTGLKVMHAPVLN